MNAPAALRKGWCPGALRPMPAGDGLLARVRVSAAAVLRSTAPRRSPIARRDSAMASSRFPRAPICNFAASREATAGLQRRLDELGLLDADAAAENVRNIVASPLADIDPSAVLDVGAGRRGAGGAASRDDPSLRRLPPKFGFLIDGGGALPLGDVEADVRFEAFRRRGRSSLRGRARRRRRCRGVVRAARSRRRGGGAGAGVPAPARRANPPRRMRELVAQRGARRFSRPPASPLTAAVRDAPRRARRGDLLGVHAFGEHCVGAGAVTGPHDGRRFTRSRGKRGAVRRSPTSGSPRGAR